MNILLVGTPKSGKTTLMKGLLERYSNKMGFFTDEIRENGVRTGFEIVTTKGEKRLFASIHIDTPRKVGKYSVDISKLDEIIPSLLTYSPHDILVIDEIGPMELISDSFQKLCTAYLDAPNLCIATSQIYVNDFTESIKKRQDTLVFEITEETRDLKREEILRTIESFYKIQ